MRIQHKRDLSKYRISACNYNKPMILTLHCISKFKLIDVTDLTSPPDQLIQFCKSLSTDKSLQTQVKGAISPEKIIELAASKGYEISHNELRTWSKDLAAPYFPWAEMGNEWRRNFFN